RTRHPTDACGCRFYPGSAPLELPLRKVWCSLCALRCRAHVLGNDSAHSSRIERELLALLRVKVCTGSCLLRGFRCSGTGYFPVGFVETARIFPLRVQLLRAALDDARLSCGWIGTAFQTKHIKTLPCLSSVRRALAGRLFTMSLLGFQLPCSPPGSYFTTIIPREFHSYRPMNWRRSTEESLRRTSMATPVFRT
ncbi:hypothetical protein AAVH_42119, partial [Aphelenchoides avenae]